MHPTPPASLARAEVRDLVRIHAKMFAFLGYSRTNPGHDEERAHIFAERHWRRFRGRAIDYLAVSIALKERDAAAPLN